MVPLESFGTVSYSYSRATMAVSLAISTQYTNVIDTQPPSKTTGTAAMQLCLAGDARQKCTDYSATRM